MVLQCSKTLSDSESTDYCTCTVYVHAHVIETTTYTVTCPSLSVHAHPTCTSAYLHTFSLFSYDTLHVTFHRSCMPANSLIFPFLHHIMLYIPLVLIIPISPCPEYKYHCEICNHHPSLQTWQLFVSRSW